MSAGERRCAAMPDPTTTVTRRAVPRNSATKRRNRDGVGIDAILPVTVGRSASAASDQLQQLLALAVAAGPSEDGGRQQQRLNGTVSCQQAREVSYTAPRPSSSGCASAMT